MGHTPVKFNKWILQTGGVLLMIMAFPSIVFGQEAKQQDSITAVPFFSLSGTLTLTSDFYTYSSTPDGSQRGRRPASLYRLLFSPTLKFGNAISLPFHIVLTVPETNTSTPSVRHPTVIQFLQNPANAFGFSSFAPRIGWAQFNLGSYSPNFSPLTVGDQQLFGAGFDLRPGNFRIAANLGTSQRAIEPDTIRHIPGAYKRDMYMGRFAFGKEDGSILGVNLVYAKDVQSSLKNNISSISLSHPLVNNLSVIIPADTFRLRAEEGIVTSFDAKVKITNTISFKAEGALSSFTRDLHAPELTSNKNPLDIIQKTRTSTRADFAAATTFTIKQEQWGIKFSGRYMGAGFVPVGYPYMQADRIEFAGAPNFNLFNNKLSVSGSIGQRVNNVSKTKGETSTQLIASADVNLNLSNAFSISSSYSNFGIRNDKTSDTLKVQTVSQAVSINPILTLKQESLTHLIMVSASIDDFTDLNIISGEENSNKMQSVLGSYTISLNDIPLSMNITGTYLENELSLGKLVIRSIGGKVSYSFLKRKLLSSFSMTTSKNTFGSAPADDQVFYRITLRWRPGKSIEVKASAGNNHYSYGNPIPHGSEFQEQMFQLSLAIKY